MIGIQVSGVVYQGADFVVSEVFQNPDGSAFDWTNYSLSGTLVDKDRVPVASFDPNSFVIDGVTGRLTATILGGDLEGIIDDAVYSFDVRGVNGPNVVIPFYGRKSLRGVQKVTE